MAFKDMFQHEIICGKDIYIFESHHYAIYPWALVKRNNITNDINLFSFGLNEKLIAK